MSQVTSHVLDTTSGRPAAGITVTFYQGDNNDWLELSGSVTNNEGRVTHLLPPDTFLKPGLYKLKFMTRQYFNGQSLNSLYPYIDIIFEIQDNEHYHIPLLLTPFGYSTYRGS